MSPLLQELEHGYEKYLYDPKHGKLLLEKCMEDTHEFKTQLRRLKAHLTKNIQEAQTEKGQNSKHAKKRELIVEKINKAHKQWDGTVKKQLKYTSSQYSKFHKTTVRNLVDFKLDKIYVYKLPSNSKTYVDKAVGAHISRYNMGNLPVQQVPDMLNYMHDVYNVEENVARKYAPMGQILQDLNSGNATTCLEWCDKESELHFELYFLISMQLLSKGNRLETLKYLQQGIPVGMAKNRYHSLINNVSPLLTRLMLNSDIDNLDEIMASQRRRCISMFTEEYCTKNSLSFHSSLFLVVLSGIISFQFYTKYKNIRASAHVDWTTKDELPFDVKLPSFLTNFHPVFICPVLKEETTLANPPYSLPCHHVISKKALDRLSKNGTTLFKCPYCPINASISKTRKVRFVMI